MNTTFFRVLKDKDKEPALKKAIDSYNAKGQDEESVFTIEPEKFKKVPNSPFAYWVDDSIRDLFQKFPPFESKGRTVKQGLITADDFRFVRTWWEVPVKKRLDARIGPNWRNDIKVFQKWCRERTKKDKYWVSFAKGGEYSPYFSDIHLVVNWGRDGKELKNFVNPKTGKLNSRPQNTDFYFCGGLTYPFRSQRGFSAGPLNAGSIFALQGSAIFCKPEELIFALIYFNSSLCQHLLNLVTSFSAWQTGYVGCMPFPKKIINVSNFLSKYMEVIDVLKGTIETDLFFN